MNRTMSLTRRKFTKVASMLPIAALPTVAITVAPVVSDPLLELIARYYRGMEELDLDDEATGAAHSAVVRQLNAWTEPARTSESAAAALRLALYEVDNFSNSPTATAMINAAIAYIGRTAA